MPNLQIVDEYYIWLLDLVESNGFCSDGYNRVLNKLFEEEFYWSITGDRNRAIDGIKLRSIFGEQDYVGASYLLASMPDYCTVLEMMVALAKRMEDDIMYDPDVPNRTGIWFGVMMENLGMLELDDRRFDEEIFYEKLNIFLNRSYPDDGEGSLFGPLLGHFCMPKTEIWYQMHHYINEKFG